MALDRTWFNTLVDDGGDNTTGTLWDKAAVDHVYDDVDAQLAAIDTHFADVESDIANVRTVDTVVSRTDTGTVNNWAPGLNGHTYIDWSSFTTSMTLTGIAGGVTGQRVTIRNGSGVVAYFAYNNSGSAAANRLFNIVQGAPTPIVNGGWITYEYNGAGWAMVGHDQGAWITPTYAGSNFTSNAGSWTVESGDVATFQYRLSGKGLTVSWYLQTTSVTGTPTVLKILIPNGFVANKTTLHPLIHDDNAAGNAGSFCIAANNSIDCYKAYGGGAFANATNTTRLFGTITFEVQ